MDRSEPLAKSLPLLAFGVAGAALATLFSARTPAPGTAANTAVRAESMQGVPSLPRDHIVGARPALELLADYLGVPTNVERFERNARWTAAEIRARDDRKTPQAAAVAERLATGFRAAGAADRDIPDLAALTVQELKDPAGVHRRELLDEIALVQETDDLLVAVQRGLGLNQLDHPSAPGEPSCVPVTDVPAGDRGSARCPPELKIVVATMPDYAESYSAWIFDRNVDGIQRAAGAAGYVLDRFRLPDWDPESIRPKGERHRFEPGAILFKSGGRSRNRLLLVLMPLETATAGIQKHAFLSAVTLARALTPPDEQVRILGPSFSGSSLSLRMAMQEALYESLVKPGPPASPVDPPEPAKTAILVRSGSATSPRNKGVLERSYCVSGEPGAGCETRLVRFEATTVSDLDTQNALAHFLGTIDRDWAIGQGVAILYEANTVFGQGLGQGQSLDQGLGQGVGQLPTPGEKRPPPPPDIRDNKPNAFPFPCAVRLTYPLHISRLRAQARDRGPAGSAVLLGGPGIVPLRLEDPAIPKDQLPSVRPEATAAVVQTTLATILDTLERSQVGAVGLFGTDDRDKIFLAEQIRYRFPNVQLFTMEGGLAFLHPETRAFLRGAVVAASYPLFSATQLASGSARTPLHQFQGVGAEGIYNALLTLLDEGQLRGRLLDYETKDCGTERPSSAQPSNDWRCGPGVWISVVGHNAIWPVRRYGLTSANEGYTWLPPKPPAQPPASASTASDFRLERVALRLEEAPSPATAVVPSIPTAPRGEDRAREAPGAPRWPGSAWLLFGLVAATMFAHLLGLLALAWALGLGGSWRAKAAIAKIGSRLEARLRRHVPWLEPPDLCAARWTRKARSADTSGEPPVSPDPQEARRLAARGEGLRQEYWLSLLACGGALLAVAAWVSQLMAVGLDVAADGGPSATLNLLLKSGRVVLGIGFLVAAVAVLRPSAARREAGLGALIALRTVPVLLGVATLGFLGVYLSGGILTTRQAAFNALRLAEITSLVSPTVPVTLLAAAVYLWGLWNLWRVHEQAVEFGQGASVIAVLRGDQPATARRFSRLLDAPELAIGLPAATFLAALVAIEGGAVLPLSFRMHSVDGKWMAWALWSATVLVSFLVCHALAHGLGQGRALLDGLRSLGLAPIGRAFAGLGGQPELWQPSAGIPRAREVHVLVQQVRATVRAFDDARSDASTDPPRCPALPAPEPPPQRSLAPGAREAGRVREAACAPAPEPDALDRDLARRLYVRPGDAVELRWGPASASMPATDEDEQRPLHASPAWREIERWSEHLVRVLSRGPWARRTCPVIAVAPKKEEPAVDADAHVRAAETLLALQVAFSVRSALVRLMSVFALAVTGLLLLLAAHLLYTFQSRAFWLGVDWILIGTATAIIVYLLVRLEKSTLLSLLWRSEPGKLKWSDQLVHRILLYGAIPVITLFVTFFPEVGATLFSWLEPVQKSLP